MRNRVSTPAGQSSQVPGPSDRGGSAEPSAPGPLRYRVAFSLIATLLLLILVTLPFSVGSILDDLLGPPQGRSYALSAVPHSSAAATHTDLHLAVVALDEEQLQATLRASGHHVCEATCAWSDRVVFFSLAEDELTTEGLPPSAAVTLEPTTAEVTQMVQLPVRGRPIRYPFDHYELRLGVVLQRVAPDGSVQTLAPAEAAGQLFLTFQEQLPLQTMTPPAPLDPRGVRTEHDPYEYLLVAALSFHRPLYLPVLAVLLVLLVAGAAAYAVFLRPLQELVVNSGALVLGIWGIRSIITPPGLTFVTAMDVSLSMVIIFLLTAITVRALLFFHERGNLHVLRRRPREQRGVPLGDGRIER